LTQQAEPHPCMPTLTAATAAKLPAGTGWRIVAPFAAGYFISYVYRTINAVIAPELGQAFALDANDLGLLTSVYFLSFALFQIPLGLLLDRYGARRVQALLLLMATTGALVFAFSSGREGLIAGRALIGLGVSACLMASFKAFTSWFPRERLAMVNGIVLSAGGLGALCATAPVETALHFVGWRWVFVSLSGATLLIAAMTWFVVPERAETHAQETWRSQVQGLGGIFASRRFWRVSPLALTQAIFLSIHGLWSGPWLTDVAGLTRADAAHHLSLTAIAMICGYYSVGALATRLSRSGVKPIVVAKIGLLFFLLVQVALTAGYSGATVPLWIAFGFFGTTASLSYAVLAQEFAPSLAGRLNTAMNLLVFVAAFALQWALGAILDLWPADGGYPLVAYHAAFGLTLTLQTIAFIWLIWPARSPSIPGTMTPESKPVMPRAD